MTIKKGKRLAGIAIIVSAIFLETSCDNTIPRNGDSRLMASKPNVSAKDNIDFDAIDKIIIYYISHEGFVQSLDQDFLMMSPSSPETLQKFPNIKIIQDININQDVNAEDENTKLPIKIIKRALKRFPYEHCIILLHDGDFRIGCVLFSENNELVNIFIAIDFSIVKINDKTYEMTPDIVNSIIINLPLPYYRITRELLSSEDMQIPDLTKPDNYLKFIDGLE